MDTHPILDIIADIVFSYKPKQSNNYIDIISSPIAPVIKAHNQNLIAKQDIPQGTIIASFNDTELLETIKKVQQSITITVIAKPYRGNVIIDNNMDVIAIKLIKKDSKVTMYSDDLEKPILFRAPNYVTYYLMQFFTIVIFIVSIILLMNIAYNNGFWR